MKITKKLEAEISKFLDTYWRTYFEGNLDKWSSFIPDDFRNIGTTNEELWSSKKDILDYTKSVIDQMVGQADIRNKKIEIFSYEPYIMAHELGDLYVKNEEEWVFYAPFRLSSILTQTNNGWLVLHQHGSYPDSRAAVGEAFSLDALKIENQKLLEAVAQRTKELENKNKELAIEAALERVRAVAMGMEEAADLLKICRVVYKELEGLGFVELRNTMVNLNNDQKSLLDNYDYSGKSGGEVTVIPYDSHPATRNIVNKLKKSANAFGQFALTGKKLDEWRSYRKELGEKDDPQLKSTKKLSYYFYSVGTASIGVSTYKPISKEQLALLERFRNVFELAYRRYTDIKKAEEQAREARIEAALEKVRARTMAMQHSSELPEAANLLFLEVQALGIPAWSCGYNILNEDKKSVMCWMSSEGQIQSGFHLPFTNTGEKSFPQWEKAIKNKVPFLVQELGGKDIEEHYNYMRTLPGLEPVLEELDAAGLALPTYQINHLSFFKGGFLLFITYEQVPQAHDLFKRFTKVFEQTFTRFLDLQKAEAQAREAQIEAALERVRARTMAMHKSEELSETTYLLFKEITALGETSEQTSIGIFNNDEKTMDLYSTVHGSQWKEAVSVTLTEPTVMKKIHAGWRTKQKQLVIDLSGGNLKKYNVFRQKLSGEEYNIKRWVVHAAYFSHGALTFSSTKPYPEKTIRLIERFAKVFDGTYTRFLDLKKAEAQARESQIEAALERVRASSMAMHKTQDIADVVVVFFEQLKLLEVKFVQSWINVVHPEEGIIDVWFSPLEEVYDEPAFFRIPLALFENTTVKSWKAGETFSYVTFNSKKELNALFKACDKATNSNYFGHLQKKLQLERLEFLDANYKYGAVSKSGVVKATLEEEAILHRFAKVFEQTYTRFLDLQHAEAQAREAKIETALERVRSRAMAMHKSEELADLSLELVRQVQALGEDTWFCAFNISDDDPKGSLEWGSNGEGTFPQYRTPREGVFLKYYKAGQKGESLLVNEIGPDECPAHYEYLCSLPGVGDQLLRMKAEGIPFPTAQIDHVAFFNYGYVLFITYKPAPELHDVFKRFAKVFEQSYTRFLHLQKAEQQAREAEIEASLERVRSRTMAMKTQHDLLNVIETFGNQLATLGLEIDTVSVIHGVTKSDWDLWLYTPDSGVAPFRVFVPYIDTPYFTKTVKNIEAYERTGNPIQIKSFNKDEKDEFNAHYFMCAPAMPKEYQDAAIAHEQCTIVDAFLEEVTVSLLNYSIEGFSENDIEIFTRFSKEFKQAYTRFLDLQKAEAQAREAQIEIALERVRSRTMAMHSSEELAETAAVLFQQLRELGLAHERTNIGIVDEANNKIDFWVTTQTGELVDKPFPARIDESKTTATIYKGYKDNKKSIVIDLKGAELKQWITYITQTLSIPYSAPSKDDRRIQSVGYFSKGMLIATSVEPLNNEALNILERFAAVFDQTYTRFLDLQKAEAQAREAQIEAALEKVRSKAMAMHSSEDLSLTVDAFFNELTSLNVAPHRCGVTLIDKETRMANLTVTTATARGKAKKVKGELKLSGHQVLDSVYEHWKRQEEYHPVLHGAEIKDYYQAMNPQVEFPDFANDKTQFGYYFFFNEGGVYAWTDVELVEEELLIFRRFTTVLSLTYRRFMDLKESEAQAREAKIEAALDRIRARSMAMHSSDELVEASDVMISELNKLKINALRVGICTIDEESGSSKIWSRSEVKGKHENKILGIVPRGAHPVFDNMVKARKKGEVYYTSTREGVKVKDYYDRVSVYLSYPKPKKFNSKETISAFFFKEGSLNVVSLEPLNEEDSGIMIRFASVFNQTYTRFLDLQKAEAQTREAQIEASLERVRAQAMAMHSSEDLAKTMLTFYQEFVPLSTIPIIRTGVSLLNKENYLCHISSVSKTEDGKLHQVQGILDISENPYLMRGYKSWLKGKSHKLVLRGNQIKEYFQHINSQLNYPDQPKDAVQYMYFDSFAEGVFYVASEQEFTAEELKVQQRFTSVLGLTYKRYKDIMDSEAREKEAIKDASLDRVRAEIASMRSPKDLERITPLIWKELTTLGVPFFRCGIFIIKEEEEVVHAYLSTPAGESLAALHIPFDETEIGMIVPSIDNWRKQTVYREEWDQKRFLENMQLFMKRGDVKSSKKYQAGDKPPEKLVLHLVPFKQGMLYVGNSASLVQEHINLMKALAKAFSIAYSRYEDFVQLEEAKKKVDLALTDLKSAQSQLVHAEKMASLGELTAGIAHEIQNPLNFVNNFSEVNKELMEELIEEMLKGDYEEAKAIARDIMDNDAKIMHHGKRAEGIVKGMLQHSRTSSGEKEPTDINVLADEYLRLSYHGLRAKDKSFNADFEAILDPDLPTISVVPQDIGRVLLNLINNAFHACTERSRSAVSSESVNPTEKGASNYKPKVIVKTIDLGNKIQITVTDNGPGIPEEIKDKIFQPFFTTKATGEGTGLGLSLSYDIITKGHGGELGIDTSETTGASFTIILPIQAKS